MGDRSMMRDPVEPILQRHGITVKEKKKGDVVWFDLSECPVCNHDGYQCGVSEEVGRDGKLVHGFKCWHEDTTDYGEFLRALNYDIPTDFRRGLRLVEKAQPDKTPLTEKPLSEEANAFFRNRLRGNLEAMRYLTDRGLAVETIEHFKLGLSRPYKNTDDSISDNCLMYPIFGHEGWPFKKYGYYNIPGVSENPRDKNGWMQGQVMTYYADQAQGKTALMVCEGAKDLWRTWQALQGTDLGRDLLLVTSTHGKGLPKEWKESKFWDGWDRVYFGHDNDPAGDRMAERLLEFCGREALRVRVPESFGKDWTDFFQSGGTVEAFRQILDDSPVASPITVEEDGTKNTGVMAYKPIDIDGAYHKGHLYYSVSGLERKLAKVKQPDGTVKEELQERRKTMVARSDGALLDVRMMPAPPGTPPEDRTLRLSDGTLIEKQPAPSRYATWEWDSVNRYCNTKGAGGTLKMRSLGALYEDLYDYLSNKVWLPYKDDYTLLALAAIATYVQPIFDAVPLFLVNGPKGSGKTELGNAMKEVCANAAMIGQGTAATIARVIDQSRGFVVLDDLESVGRKKQDDQFGELIQALKLSYKQSTAVKLWTDVKKGMKVEKLNFFGIKMINNTTGVDAILGSRMFIIQTRKRSKAEKDAWDKSHRYIADEPAELRNELHAWAFQSAQEVEKSYRIQFPQSGERSDEIAAPLRVLVEMIGSGSIKARLDAALSRQSNQPRDIDDPVDILEESLRNLVIEGYRQITIHHASLEMRRLVPDNYGQERTSDIPECFRPEWIGRTLRGQGWIDLNKQPRVRVGGMNLRAMHVDEAFVEESLADREMRGADLLPGELKKAKDFCIGCESCPYRTCGCDIMERKEGAGGKKKKPASRARAH